MGGISVTKTACTAAPNTLDATDPQAADHVGQTPFFKTYRGNDPLPPLRTKSQKISGDLELPMAAPTKPIEQKRKLGRTPHTDSGGRRLPSAVALAPVQSADLGVRALAPAEVMEQVLDRGVYWLGETDAPTLALAREALEDYAEVRAAGDMGATLKARDQVMRLFGKLGFDPEARSRLGLAEVKAKSKVEEIIDRRRARSA